MIASEETGVRASREVWAGWNRREVLGRPRMGASIPSGERHGLVELMGVLMKKGRVLSTQS